jgi:hypothetical protein
MRVLCQDGKVGGCVELFVKIPVLLVVVVAAAGLAITTHEVGHLISGWFARLRVFMFCVGPARFERRADGRLHICWVRSIGEAGGMVGMALADSRDEQGIRRALTLFALGGPIASLLCGAAALAAFFLFGLSETTWERDGMMKAVAGGVLMYSVSSLGMAFVTAFPHRFAGIASDGERVRLMLRRDPVAGRDGALFAMTGWSVMGRPPRDWDPAIVAAAMLPGDDGTNDAALARCFAFVRALDCCDIAEASIHASVMAAASAPPAMRSLMRAEAAYFAAAYQCDAATARDRLAEAVVHAPLDPQTRRRVEAAILLAGDDAAAGATALCALAAEVEADADAGFLRDELRRLADRRGVALVLPTHGTAC